MCKFGSGTRSESLSQAEDKSCFEVNAERQELNRLRKKSRSG